ncbi:MAG: alpha/beta fold hydrolase [Myxococcota bacterium]
MEAQLRAPQSKPWKELPVIWDMMRLPKFWSTLEHRVQQAKTVWVLPGFMTGDWSTWALRKTLTLAGHSVCGWGIGKNDGDVLHLTKKILSRLNKFPEGPKIHLVGWSLGGVIAREVAREAPERIAQVISMASPVIGGPKYTVAARYYRETLGVDLDVFEQEVESRESIPLQIPVTALYSPKDAVVCPEACIDVHNKQVKHIPISCSHSSFGFCPEVHKHVLQCLQARVDGQETTNEKSLLQKQQTRSIL